MKQLIAFVLSCCLIMAVGCTDDGPTIVIKDHVDGRLYVLNQADTTLSIYNSKNLEHLATISTIVPEPHYLRFSANKSYYYIVSRVSRTSGGGQIAKFRTSDNSLMDSVNTNVFPTALIFSNNGDTCYVVDFTDGDGHFHRYDIRDTAMVFIDSVLQAGYQTHDVDISNDGRYIVAPGFNSDDVAIVNTINADVGFLHLDTAFGETKGNPSLGIKYGPYGIKLTNADTLAWVACSKGTDQVRLIDIKNKVVLDSVLISVSNDPNPNRNGPTLMDITANDSRLLLTNYIDNTLSVIDTENKTVIKTVSFSTPRPFSVQISEDGSRVFVSCTNVRPAKGMVYILDGSSFNKLDSITVGSEPFGIRWRPL